MDFECIICLDEINTTELLLLECCNQPAHLKCIKNWLEKNNKKNINLSLCIYCKQYNDTLKKMVDINKINESNETNVNNTITNTNNTIITIFHNENISNNINMAINNRRNQKLCVVGNLLILLFALFLFIVIYIIPDSNNKEKMSYPSRRGIKQGGAG
jgi:hypothetical protein